MSQDFSVNDFVPFEGIVEGRKDPAMMGRVQVRIFGLHNEDKTENLPWAQVLMPVTGYRTNVVPKEGEWVFGYFQDGKNRQHPVIMGVHPGIVPKPTTITQNIQAGNNFKVSPLILTNSPAGSPKPPSGIAGDVPGEPTNPRIARGVMEQTMVDKMNNLLNVNCEFKLEVQKNSKLKQYTKAIADKIREAIRWIVKTLGLTDVTGNYSWVINTLRTYARALKYIRKKILKPIQDFTKYVLSYITLVRQLVQWILSLPAKLLKMLQTCLNQLLKSIANVFSDMVSGTGSSIDTGFDSAGWQEIVTEAQKAYEETTGLLSDTMTTLAGVAAIPVAATAGLLTPVSDADVAEANKYIAEYENSDENKLKSPNEGMKAP